VTPCQPIAIDGTTAIVCSRRQTRRCSICRARPATKLCDYPAGPGRTCDAALCTACSRHVGPDRDFCSTHPEGPGEQLGLGGL